MSTALDAHDGTRIQADVAPDRAQHHRCHGIKAGWIVAVTRPQAERHADANLRRQGYRTYLPIVPTRRRDPVVRGLVHRGNAPLFPGYLFVWHSRSDPRRPIRETPGIRALVKCGSELQYARAGAVEAVQAVVAIRQNALPLSSAWRPGMACEPAGGPFRGHPAVILQVGRDMALVSMLVFGELREVALQLDALMPRET